MKKAKPWKPDGRTFEEYAAALQREADRKAREAWDKLWRFGDYDRKQRRLPE